MGNEKWDARVCHNDFTLSSYSAGLFPINIVSILLFEVFCFSSSFISDPVLKNVKLIPPIQEASSRCMEDREG